MTSFPIYHTAFAWNLSDPGRNDEDRYPMGRVIIDCMAKGLSSMWGNTIEQWIPTGLLWARLRSLTPYLS